MLCLSVSCPMHAVSVRARRGHNILLELELQRVVTNHVSAGIWTWSSEEQSVLLLPSHLSSPYFLKKKKINMCGFFVSMYACLPHACLDS